MLTFLERSKIQKNPIGKKLFEIMSEKETNLSLSADVTTKSDLISLAKSIGDHICVLKTHIDIIEDTDMDMIHEISELSVKHNFLIFEDRKFADIGNTVRLQYQNGPFKISSWTDMANFHIIPGPGVLDGLIAANSKTDRAFIVLSQMSSKGSMMTDEYSKESIRLAENHPNDVIGFICQNKQSSDPRFLHMTPGVSLINSSDSFGQQYRSPERAIVQDGCDIIIVGRGIIESNDIVSEAVKYKNAAWNAHLASLNPKEKRIYEPA